LSIVMGSSPARVLLATVLLSGLAGCPGGRELPADQKVCKTCCDPKLPCYLDWGTTGDRGLVDGLVLDRRRDQQPSVDQKPCAWDSCGTCPDTFCGAPKHSACVSNDKCRCLPGWVGDNPSVYDPVNGCYIQVTGCNPPSACNPCGIGVCGPNADCNSGKCACNSGFANCDSDWFNNGCECHGTCGNCT
jgi:hypothetical protein